MKSGWQDVHDVFGGFMGAMLYREGEPFAKVIPHGAADKYRVEVRNHSGSATWKPLYGMRRVRVFRTLEGARRAAENGM